MASKGADAPGADPSAKRPRVTSPPASSERATPRAGVVVKVGPSGTPPAEAVERAVAVLRDGGIVAVPTDTLYGVACDATNADAVAGVYRLKGRSAGCPLAVCVKDLDSVGTVARVEGLPAGLVAALLPGPYTLVLRRKPPPALPAALNPGVDTIGVRVFEGSSLPAALASALPSGVIALTSANRHGAKSPLAVSDFADLLGGIGVCFDGGVIAASRQGSTVVDLSRCADGGPWRVLRPGDGLSRMHALLEQHGLKEEC
eukprot:TRINITY_DN60661_c0_g1_i1.p1 TRINITY_DN60661_c0_g1~~TRINITY_DN60661_c0_g1_i1.p1  ORF type:complete len:281 (+),score=74.16 TRINITY_DN60661_c0_g1_i1:68-844(+)